MQQIKKIIPKIMFCWAVGISSSYANNLPLDFQVKPHFPIVTSGNGTTTINYVLKNNSNKYLTFQINLKPNEYFQINNNGNTCTKGIGPGYSCILPIYFHASKYRSQMRARLDETIKGTLEINYGGTSPLLDELIFTISDKGALNVQMDPYNHHLSYQALKVENISAKPMNISNVTISDDIAGRVEWCQPGQSSCAYQSTCQLGREIPAGANCSIWLRTANDKYWPLGTAKGTVSIQVNDHTGYSFNVNYRQDLYAGNYYSYSDPFFARWDGHQWMDLTPVLSKPGINALAMYKGDLYFGGSFQIQNPTDPFKFINNIGRWDGTSLSEVGAGLNEDVFTLATYGDELYAGGHFTKSGNANMKNVARWNGSKWSYARFELDADVNTLTEIDGKFYAGLRVYQSGDEPYGMAVFDGQQWSREMGTGIDNDVNAIASFNSELYAAGDFEYPASKIAKWSTQQTWSPVGLGIDNTVYAFTTNNGLLYAGGRFTNAGGTPIANIARWDGKTWLPVGLGLDKAVYALTSHDGNVYAGGMFTNASGIAAQGIARYDGKNWFPLSNEVLHSVKALLVASSLEIS